MTPTTRPLVFDDVPEILRLGVEAFGTPPPGSPAPPPPDPATFPQPGRHHFGTFDGDRLAARVVGREYHSWFHGVEVATCGIAGVTVGAEHRRAGLLEQLFRDVLADGSSRGEVVSTLFPTAPGIYRRFGYELISSYDEVEVPTSALEAVRAVDEGLTLRRATADDVPAVRRVQEAWASAQNGPLTRRGPSFPATDQEVLEELTGITLACRGDEVVGFAAWDRGTGYDASAVLEVVDLVGLTPGATAALCRMLGSFSPVTGRVRFCTSGFDPVRLFLPSAAWPVVDTHPYMLRVHDVVGACTGLRLGLDATVRFAVAGDLLGTMDGCYEVSVVDGTSACTRVDDAEVATFTPRGLAQAWAGVASCADLRMAGLLTGPTTYDARIDALFGGRQAHIRDYF